MSSPHVPRSTFTDIISSRSPSPELAIVDALHGKNTTDSLSCESVTRPGSAEPADNNSASSISTSSFSVSFFNDPGALAPSQYSPALKRKASQDLTCFAEEQARSVGLDENSVLEISNQFAHYSTDQKLIALYIGQKRQAIEFQRVVKAAQGPPAIHAALQDKIKKVAFLVMIDPALPAYLADNKPIQLVLGFLSKYPGWGYTKAATADPKMNALIRTLVRDTLTDIRSEFKVVIAKASGFHPKPEVCDIEVLCKRILGLRTGKHGCKLTQPSLQMVARFAVLRKVYVSERNQAPGADSDFRKYWKAVDATLAVEIPEVAKELNWPVSKLISKTLSLDCKTYPRGGDRLPGVDATSEPYSPQAQLDSEDITAGCFSA